ncbi:MAG: cyclase family protein [Candidatus Cloacimonetes bacterium]|nr:cyclase family protein [Candidatus Cloacimonadota bacterium]
MKKYIDLSQTLENRMLVYQGHPETELKSLASVEKDGYTNHLLTTGLHTGTHIDAPGHMLVDGVQHNAFPLDRYINSGVILNAKGRKIIDSSIIDKSIPKGSIVLVYTGHDKNFKKENYYTEFPVIDKSLAEELIKAEISMIGLDTPSPDGPPYEIHKLFFENNIMIAEHLTNLDKLLEVQKFEVFALPLKNKLNEMLARVIAVVE